ncbi:hypothetical protein [Bradyrhizobium elkanii]|uniref:hypothetical protein n=1 Tax=Bradyrhizobium elkanii TaxID=29448 RepID=UPI003512856B
MTNSMFSTAAIKKHQNKPRSRSVDRLATIAGSAIEAMIMACCANLIPEASGLNAQATLAPASAR